jgi:hypothetical protein
MQPLRNVPAERERSIIRVAVVAVENSIGAPYDLFKVQEDVML